jgi:3-deoxy-7-phosphoheptulonate synthase
MKSTRGDESLIIVMTSSAAPEDVANVIERLESIGAEAHVSEGKHRTVIGAVGDRNAIQQLPWEAFPGVERAVPVLKPFKFVSRDFQVEDTVVDVGGSLVGGGNFAPIAGPCAVESRDQLFASAEAVSKAGATILRGDAFKPRTSPYSFQGLAEKGLELLAEARSEFGMPFVAEAVDPRDVELVSSYADLIRVGTRNMANFTLLSELGKQDKPVMLKRGLTATIEEWLNAAEYIYKEGNHDVILCERGIRTFETATRNTLDISAVPVIKELSHLPVIVDPSHSGGKRTLVAALTRTAVAAGADGFMIDVHPAPETALVDGPQAILPGEFSELMEQVRALLDAMESFR